ncbi:MAG TPA: hypothetical protein VGK68_00480 [Gaiellaceae bacterium]
MPRKVVAEQLQLEATAEPSRRRKRSTNSETARLAKRASQRSSAVELLKTPGALLTRTHLRGLGLERRAVDAVFRALPIVALPGYSRPMVRAEDYVELIECNTYRDDRVRPL